MCHPTTTHNVSSIADDMECLNDVYSKACNWQVNYFPITIAISLLDNTPQVINLANTIGKKTLRQSLYQQTECSEQVFVAC
jgi:hypothetical protein